MLSCVPFSELSRGNSWLLFTLVTELLTERLDIVPERLRDVSWVGYADTSTESFCEYVTFTLDLFDRISLLTVELFAKDVLFSLPLHDIVDVFGKGCWIVMVAVSSVSTVGN